MSESEDDIMPAKEVTGLLQDKNSNINAVPSSNKKALCCRPGYPKSVFFIVGTEFCERFSYYGMKTILVIYLTRFLLFSDSKATAVYHGFSMLCYFTPIFGAMIADGLLGKYKTILYISLIYCAGNLVMAVTAIPPPEAAGPLIGLLLIAIGTGGIKPCVSAFGGDQFSSDQEKELQGFFSVFYFSINAGSLLSTFLTPILRADVHCSGDTNCDDCYPLAFGVPAALMFVALALFAAGHKSYKRYPPEGNVVGKVVMATGSAVKNKFRNGRNGESKEHWLQHADGKYESSFLEDIRAVYRVLFLFIPLPVFWALFDQQGSRWTLQAEKMNGDIGIPGWYIKPDQMQVLNPIMILLLIPLFESVIYPLLDKCKIPNRPLQRMVAGMVLASAAFVVAGFLHLRVEGSEVPLTNSQSDVIVINTLPCSVNMESSIYNGTIASYNSSGELRVNSSEYAATFIISGPCTAAIDKKSFSSKLKLDGGKSYVSLIHNKDGKNTLDTFPGHTEKAGKGKALVSFVHAASNSSANMSVWLTHMSDPCKTKSANLPELGLSKYLLVDIGAYTVSISHDGLPSSSVSHKIKVENGGVYTAVLRDGDPGQVVVDEHVTHLPNTFSMLWQIPQYIIITTGEIMFSITGLSFAYSQAPQSMKSVLQAGWLMTVAFGNLLVVIVAETSLLPQAMEFFLFAGLMGVTILVFTFMACRYTYVFFDRDIDRELSEAGFANLEVRDDTEEAKDDETEKQASQ